VLVLPIIYMSELKDVPIQPKVSSTSKSWPGVGPHDPRLQDEDMAGTAGDASYSEISGMFRHRFWFVLKRRLHDDIPPYRAMSIGILGGSVRLDHMAKLDVNLEPKRAESEGSTFVVREVNPAEFSLVCRPL